MPLFLILPGICLFLLVYPHYPILSQNIQLKQKFYFTSPELEENSGLILHHDKLLIINDSKNEARIYVCDTLQGAILHSCAILNADNRDWEDLAADAQFVYVGDFGNNSGMRGVFTVYRISLDCVLNKKACKAEAITFECADQKEFSRRSRRHDFDFEGLAACGDSLVLFSKNWNSLSTRLYVLSKVPGHYRLTPQQTLNVNGLVTGADYLESEKTMVLCGYKLTPEGGENFIILWKKFGLPLTAYPSFRRFSLSGIPLLQTEGVVALSPQRFWISHEAQKHKTTEIQPALLEIRLPR